MPDSLLTTGGAGGFGAILGAIMTFFGIKSKIADVDKRVDRLADAVVYEDTCIAVQNGFDKQFETIQTTQIDMQHDIKEILKTVKR